MAYELQLPSLTYGFQLFDISQFVIDILYLGVNSLFYGDESFELSIHEYTWTCIANSIVGKHSIRKSCILVELLLYFGDRQTHRLFLRIPTGLNMVFPLLLWCPMWSRLFIFTIYFCIVCMLIHKTILETGWKLFFKIGQPLSIWIWNSNFFETLASRPCQIFPS